MIGREVNIVDGPSDACACNGIVLSVERERVVGGNGGMQGRSTQIGAWTLVNSACMFRPLPYTTCDETQSFCSFTKETLSPPGAVTSCVWGVHQNGIQSHSHNQLHRAYTHAFAKVPARQFLFAAQVASSVRCESIECSSVGQVRAGLVLVAHDRQTVSVDVPPAFEEGAEPQPQVLSGLVPDGVRCEEVEISKEDHAVSVCLFVFRRRVVGVYGAGTRIGGRASLHYI